MKKKPPKPAKLPKRPLRESRLVLVDAAPIRADWLGRLDAVRAEEARWKARLQDFEQRGRLEFEAGMQSRFASLRADLLRLVEEVRGFETVAAEVYEVEERLGVSEGRAYAIVKGLTPDPTGVLSRVREGDNEDEANGFDPWREEDLPPEMREFARDMFVDFLRAQGVSKKEAERAWRASEEDFGPAPKAAKPAPRKTASTASAAQQTAETRAREMFRQIARRLHPDAGAGAMDERKLSLWQEAQQAWEARDVNRLEAVLWETEPDAAARGEAPVGTVARVVHAVRERIKDLQRQWDEIRRTPAGRLVGLDAKQSKRFWREFQYELESDRERMRYAHRELLEREWEWQRLWEREVARETRLERKAKTKGRPKLAQPEQIEMPF